MPCKNLQLISIQLEAPEEIKGLKVTIAIQFPPVNI